MSRPRHVPQRSCVACRQVRSKTEMLRVVRTPGGAVKLDAVGKVAGRGAYLCDDVRCLEQALKQKKLVRALGAALDEDVVEEIRTQVSGSSASAALKGQSNDR